jgi:type I restriction enzyme S subunit
LNLRSAKLVDIAELNPRLALPLEADARVSFVPMASVTAENPNVTNGEERNYSEVSKGYTPFLNGDLLIAKITPCFENGKIAQATLSHDVGFGSTEFHVVRARNGKADARFLLHYLRQDYIRRDGERKMTGSAGQRRVPEHFLAGLEIPLPSLAEQRRIAAILDKADEFRAKRGDTLAHVESLAQSIFLDLFGDPRANPSGWPMSKIGSVITSLRGGANLAPEDFVESGFPILHKGAIKPNGRISIDVKKKTFAPIEFAARNQRCQVDRRFMVVTLRDLVPTGPTIGLVADLRNGPYDKYLLAQGAYGFLLEQQKAVPEYLVHLSNMRAFRDILKKYSVGSTQIHIRTPIYLDILIPLPPMALQREFAKYVARLEEVKAAQSAALAATHALFASLQHRAFRGEL